MNDHTKWVLQQQALVDAFFNDIFNNINSKEKQK